jgi:tRNA(Glu) U13 pseudouridine synthase TruD
MRDACASSRRAQDLARVLKQCTSAAAMKIKHKPQDFRVRELLAEGYSGERGRHRVYRVTKTQAHRFEAAASWPSWPASAAEVGLAA